MGFSTYKDEVVLVIGGAGFIGGHLCAELAELGAHVECIDIQRSAFRDQAAQGVAVHLLDATDESALREKIKQIQPKFIFHLGADMGGMGFIGDQENDAAIALHNGKMTTNLAGIAHHMPECTVVYTSSACVYPETLQASPEAICLQEDQAYPAQPQDEYGREKLRGEEILKACISRLGIARLHNVYGPFGTFQGGREKAPAALLRKSWALWRQLKDSPNPALPLPLELWGDGQQTRTYLYVSDCVQALLKLGQYAQERPNDPTIVNVGSSEVISVAGLANLCLSLRGIESNVELVFDVAGPQGVRGRSCDGARAQKLLDWRPSVALQDGLQATANWMDEQLASQLAQAATDQEATLLKVWTTSQRHEATDSHTKFAILLPITSRGAEPREFWARIETWVMHLCRTLAGDPHAKHIMIILGLDDDDAEVGLHRDGRERLCRRLNEVLPMEGVVVVQSLSKYAPGAICHYWTALARQAYDLGATHFLLLGDDVRILTPGWVTAIVNKFEDMARDTNLPLGFGCVAFDDVSFPGFPTFPVVSRTHMEIFGGEILPDFFINQDGDPYLFQLYRPWQACEMLADARLSNDIGGSDDARYVKTRSGDWTDAPLTEGRQRVLSWLEAQGVSSEDRQPRVLVDIVVASFRVDPQFLVPLLTQHIRDPELAKKIDVGFVLIADQPREKIQRELEALEAKFGHDWRYRIRAQPVNTGAAAARNRGLQESSADYIIFLDDDVQVSAGLLEAYCRAFLEHPEQTGFVGPTCFPATKSIRCLGIRLAGVTYFWDAATYMQTMPWAVTANMACKRVPTARFRDLFPKTGGGEDIDYCLMWCGADLLSVPKAKATHPWWNDGHPRFDRFFGWARGDGALIALWPQHCWWMAPNPSEWLVLLSTSAICLGMLQWLPESMSLVRDLAPFPGTSTMLRGALAVGGGLVGGELLSAVCFAFGFPWSFDRGLYHDMVPGVWPRVRALVPATITRNCSEMGRVVGHFLRRDPHLLFRRFDWFVGKNPTFFSDDLKRTVVRNVCFFVTAFSVWYSSTRLETLW
ncbi:uncharacterized protein MONBRDRAFT_38874 [Monosiga brevicollis MX1]|uniref:UDP-glucose 4-epimerase n=1 Tax=Monosiga brevicollis TaxID=81824 RepID=A9VAQ0_MONBE|nr:uncharacterized protein MONBRDRAFT_38874 [Monosiga brevicollis MX1]EDQ85412.1 predicted protein [Monosiga brevicollis MX1]|eukprot:XP_001749823.1 hypothetical protein [Monosiga brevicollis MX1]